MNYSQWLDFLVNLNSDEILKLQKYIAYWIPHSPLPRMYAVLEIPDIEHFSIKWKTKNYVVFNSGEIKIKKDKIYLNGQQNLELGFLRFLSEWLPKILPLQLQFTLVTDIQISENFIFWMKQKFFLVKEKNSNIFSLIDP